MKSRTHPDAAAELDDASDWYNLQQPGLGYELALAFEDAVDRIERDPLQFPRLETYRGTRNVRRCRMKKFPCFVPLEILPSEVVILAVAHGSRRPNYFLRRKP